MKAEAEEMQADAEVITALELLPRSGNSERCKYRFITHSLVADRASKYFTTHERSPTGVANGIDSDDGDYS